MAKNELNGGPTPTKKELMDKLQDLSKEQLIERLAESTVLHHKNNKAFEKLLTKFKKGRELNQKLKEQLKISKQENVVLKKRLALEKEISKLNSMTVTHSRSKEKVNAANNVIQATKKGVSKFFNAVKNKTFQIGTAGKAAYQNVTDKTLEMAKNAKTQTLEAGNIAKDKVAQKGMEMKGKAVETVTNTKDKVVEAATTTKDKVVETVNTAKNKVVETTNNTKDKVIEAANATKDKTAEIGDKVKEKTVEVGEKGRKAIENTIEKGIEKKDEFIFNRKKDYHNNFQRTRAVVATANDLAVRPVSEFSKKTFKEAQKKVDLIHNKVHIELQKDGLEPKSQLQYTVKFAAVASQTATQKLYQATGVGKAVDAVKNSKMAKDLKKVFKTTTNSYKRNVELNKQKAKTLEKTQSKTMGVNLSK